MIRKLWQSWDWESTKNIVENKMRRAVGLEEADAKHEEETG